ncbi:MAG: hypothetical protein P4L69_17915, partial [Desulfosporosinus sp.]|nr:hypothetical protein [Desulfosporosinus sp.]
MAGEIASIAENLIQTWISRKSTSSQEWGANVVSLAGSVLAFVKSNPELSTVFGPALGAAGGVLSLGSDVDAFNNATSQIDKTAAACGVISDTSSIVMGAMALLGQVWAVPPLAAVGIGSLGLKEGIILAKPLIESGSQSVDGVINDTSDNNTVPVTLTWTSPGGSGQTSIQVTADGTYNTSTGAYVTSGGTTIPSGEVSSVTYKSGGFTVQQGADTNGNPNGSGTLVVQGTSSATLTDLGSGNQVTVAGTVNTSNLQAGQPVPVSTVDGTYRIDPASGDITVSGQSATLTGTPGTTLTADLTNGFGVQNVNGTISTIKLGDTGVDYVKSADWAGGNVLLDETTRAQIGTVEAH